MLSYVNIAGRKLGAAMANDSWLHIDNRATESILGNLGVSAKNYLV
ncbi:MAG: hypothetical protein H7256_05125 [Bdellovibrio sp.]|nr:hypothetical protein [Bdellovibrio sp.]